MKKIVKTFFLTVTGFTLCAILCLAMYIFSLDEWKSFSPAALSENELSLRLYDQNDALYLTLDNGENRLLCDYASLPAYVKNAFLSIEDTRFYEHHGIDPVRIGSALLTDLKTLSLKEGASTITQQLVKLSVLTGEKTLSRKLNEIIMALKTEAYYTKDEILELYLNKAYFGRGAYGIETAAQGYFGKSADALNIAEAATLAGIIKSPTTYAPHLDPEKCLSRRNLVLEQMRKNGAITQAEYTDALQAPLKILPSDEAYRYGYYTDYVLSTAAETLGISMRALLAGGYRIETALDCDLQSYLESQMTDDTNFPDPAADGLRAECAVVAENAQTGLVCALIGGREHTARLGFSRATDMRRQPGSAIKPILVFTPALEYAGYSTTSFLFDQPMTFGDYAPKNAGSTFRGWLTLRDTVAYSVNIPTVALFEAVGIDTCVSYAKTVGIPFCDTDDNLSLALGGFTEGITPMELAGAYLPYANGGYYTPPTPIRRILDADGNVVYDHADSQNKRVISEETAYLMSSLLSSSVEYGTAKSLYTENIPLSAKTGTTSYDDAENNKDAWIVAFNPEYIICAWMGFDKTDGAHSLKKGETGGVHPAALTKKVFQFLYQDTAAPQFSVPDSVLTVYLDEKELKENFETVAVSASADGCITEYFSASRAPHIYENDDYFDKFIYHDLT